MYMVLVHGHAWLPVCHLQCSTKKLLASSNGMQGVMHANPGKSSDFRPPPKMVKNRVRVFDQKHNFSISTNFDFFKALKLFDDVFAFPLTSPENWRSWRRWGGQKQFWKLKRDVRFNSTTVVYGKSIITYHRLEFSFCESKRGGKMKLD